MTSAFFVDFDGTITIQDTSEMVLRHFAQGDWESFDRAMDRGEISLEECMRRQFALVRTSPKEIIEFLDGEVDARPGLTDFLKVARVRGDCACIVSAGMDFYIDHFMAVRYPEFKITRISGRIEWREGEILFSFPALRNKEARDFKHDAILDARKNHVNIVYIGDGSSDYNAARSSDHIFAVRDSRLARLCRRESLPFEEFDTFSELANDIQKYL